MVRVPGQQDGVVGAGKAAEVQAAKDLEIIPAVLRHVHFGEKGGGHRALGDIANGDGVVAKGGAPGLDGVVKRAGVLVDEAGQRRAVAGVQGERLALVRAAARPDRKGAGPARGGPGAGPIRRVFNRRAPAGSLPGDGHGQRHRLRRLQPVADVKLAGPDRHEGLGVEAVARLHDGGRAVFRAAAVVAAVFPAQGGERLDAAQLVTRVDRGINGNVGFPAEHRAGEAGQKVRQNIHHVQFVPFQFAGAQMKTDQINQPGKGHDIERESDPGQHLAVDFLEPVLVQRPDHRQVGRQQRQQPAQRQLAHLLAVNHRAENAVAAQPRHVRRILVGGQPGQRNLRQFRPEPSAIFPRNKRLPLRAESQNGDPPASALGGDGQRRGVIADQGRAVPHRPGEHGQGRGFKLQGRPRC